MANIDRIISVDISLNTAGLTVEGFSTLMVVGPHGYTTERVITVADSDELLELGFKSDDPIYKAVADAKSQIPSPKFVKVGRFQCDTVRLVPEGEFVAGRELSITLNTRNAKGELVSNTYSYEVSTNDNHDSALQSIADRVTDYSYTTSVVDGTIVIKSADPNRSFTATTKGFVIGSFDMADKSIADNMALITGADNDFYGICYVSRKQEDILELADWCEAHTKLFGTAIAEEGAKSSEVDTDTGSLLKKGNYFRTHWWYHKDAETDFPEAGIMARCFAVYPGGETWANKKMSGITTDDLTEGEARAVHAKNGNTFEAFRNISITQNGKVAGGEWIDVIRFRDWLVETIKTEEFVMLINRDKLPYTDAGIMLVYNTLNSVLALGQRRGGIAPTEYDEDGNKNLGYVIEVPLASSVSANVKASRVLQDVKFTARLAGAIHAVEIKGSLTYENLIQK